MKKRNSIYKIYSVLENKPHNIWWFVDKTGLSYGICYKYLKQLIKEGSAKRKGNINGYKYFNN